MKKYIALLLLTSFLTSCISQKELTYFQGEPKENVKAYRNLQKPYRLQINDIIDIKIKATDPNLVSLFNTTQVTANSSGTSSQSLFFNSYSIDKNGFIRIPYLGELNVLGYTEKEVRLKIETELAKMFKNMDELFVKVKLAGIRYTILGEIAKPGSNTLFQNQVNLIEAIANSGDIKLTGNRKEIEVIRNELDGTKKFTIDLTDFNFVNNEGFFIKPNDIIYIKPLKEKSWGTGQTGTKTISTIVTALSLITTTIILVNRL